MSIYPVLVRIIIEAQRFTLMLMDTVVLFVLGMVARGLLVVRRIERAIMLPNYLRVPLNTSLNRSLLTLMALPLEIREKAGKRAERFALALTFPGSLGHLERLTAAVEVAQRAYQEVLKDSDDKKRWERHRDALNDVIRAGYECTRVGISNEMLGMYSIQYTDARGELEYVHSVINDFDAWSLGQTPYL